MPALQGEADNRQPATESSVSHLNDPLRKPNRLLDTRFLLNSEHKIYKNKGIFIYVRSPTYCSVMMDV